MEEILILIAQFLIEVVAQVLIELPFEFSKGRKDRPEEGSWLRYMVFLFIGGLAGGVSLYFFPGTLLHQPWLRVANLLVAPLLSAALAQAIAEHRRDANPFISPSVHAWTAFWFTLGLAGVRFAYVQH
ncbi:hypothetical protein GCM10027296_20090 [Chitinimonas naiadis]